MNIRKLKNVCDNCDYKGDNLAILSIANEIIILCADCLEELKDSLDVIDDIYKNESDVMRDRYLGIIATAYRLEITGLFHTKPVVNDEFMKKCYNRNFIRQDKTRVPIVAQP